MLPRLLALALFVLTPLVSAAQDAQEVQAVLDLTLNTIPSGEIHVRLDGDKVWADVEALERAGLISFGGTRRTIGLRTLVLLSSIEPRLEVRVDEAALQLTITAEPSLFGRSTLRFDTGRPADIVYRRATSTFLNYGASWASTGTRSLNLESGVTAGRVLVTSSFFMSATAPTSRGLTSAVVDDTARLRRYQFGDAVVSTGPLGGSLQLAGASVSRDFSLDPYFIRYPTTGLSGVVTTPSRVDLYINNQLVRSLQVQPGAYELAHIALPTGAGNTRVVVRDAFGGEQTFGGSYYVTTSVLSKGLQQYHYAVGAERLRPFDTMWDYGRPVATAVHRIGVSDSLTIGGRAEVESGLVSVGPTMTARLGRFGAVELSAAASRTGTTGFAAGIAYEYVGGPGGVSFAWREAGDQYETLTTRRAPMAPVREVYANVTTRVTRTVTVGASWQAQEVRGGGEGPKQASVTTSISLGRRLSLFLSANRARIDGVWSTGAFATLNMAFGSRGNASASMEWQGDLARGALDVQQSAPVGPGFGYRAQVAGLNTDKELVDAELRAQSRWAQADLRQTMADGQRETWAQVNGSLVAIGGRVMASRPIQDGFALVRVPDVPGVRAYVSNQEMGRTDRYGDLLVPNLLAYYGNRISIEDTDVPVDRALASRDVVLAPPYRGGAIAEFPALRQRRLAGRLVATGGLPELRGQLAVDATLYIDTPRGVVETWLGTDGEFYVEGLEPGTYPARVASSDEFTCHARLVVPGNDAPVIRLGEISCAAPESGDR